MVIVRHRDKYTGETPKIEHKELVQRAFTYLRFTLGCSVVFKERVASMSETPDVIGFKAGFSYLVECKSSRTDFLADKKKFFRGHPEQGMGYMRYLMAPVGLLSPSEISSEWGLLEVYEKPPRHRNRTVKVAKEGKRFDVGERNLANEVSYLVSAIRRLNISMAVFVENPAKRR